MAEPLDRRPAVATRTAPDSHQHHKVPCGFPADAIGIAGAGDYSLVGRYQYRSVVLHPIVSSNFRRRFASLIAGGPGMSNMADRLELCEAVLALIEKKRTEKKDPSLGE